MSIPNYTTEVLENKEICKNSHINFEERVKIEVLLSENYSAKEISNSIKRPLRTVQNEVSSRKIYMLKGTFCKYCNNNKTCEVAKKCEIHEAYGSCCVSECKTCPKSTCNNFIKAKKCNNSNNCNTCNGCNKPNCKQQKILYSAVAAQEDYNKNRKKCKQESKIIKDHNLLKYIKNNILKNKYSPDAIAGRIKTVTTSFKTTICTQTIYSAIDKGQIPGVSNINLKLKSGLKKKREKKVNFGPNTHRIGREIDKRSEEESIPTSIGHYELDLVEGIKGGKLLLTFIDRFSSELFIRKISSKSQKNVHEALDDIEKYIIKKYGENTIKSITTDNGSEFKDFNSIEKSCINDKNRCNLFYAMPYCSWQKGKIEQANWVIRTYIYKGQDIDDFSERQISNIEKTINNMPRKRLEYLTAIEYTTNSLKKIA